MSEKLTEAEMARAIERAKTIGENNPPDRAVELLALRQSGRNALVEIIRALLQQTEALTESNKAADAEMERVKACDMIADGVEDWQKLRNLCISTQSVSALRDRFEAAEAQVDALREALAKLTVASNSLIGQVVAREGRHVDRMAAVEHLGAVLREVGALSTPTPKEAGDAGREADLRSC